MKFSLQGPWKPRLISAWPALLVGLALAVQFRAPLLGRVWCFEDIAAYFHPLYTAAARQMRWGSIPSWEYGAWSGMPLTADPQVGVLYPLNWLWLLLHPLRTFAWLQLAHASIGAAGMWALIRARGRSREAAALGALSLGLGAFVVLELRHAMFIATTAWLPWLLLCIERYAQERGRFERTGSIVGGGVCAGLALLAGGWSMLYFGAVVIAILGVRAALVEPGGRAAKLRFLLALSAIALLGVGLAAVQLLPALAHTRLSPRSIGVDYQFASSYAWPSWRYLLTLLVPTLYGDDARGTYSGAPDQWELCGYAIGAVATLMIPFAFTWRERRGERIALVVACVCALDLARGDGGLLHPLFFRCVPFYASLRCPARALYIWVLAAPLLAADGFDALVARVKSPRARPLVAAALVLALAGELLFTWRAENPHVSLTETTLRPAAAEPLIHRELSGRYTNDVHHGQRFHNAGLLWGIESAGGYSSLPIWRYLHLLWIANHGSVYPHEKLAQDLTAQGLWRWSSPLVDLLSVSWVLAPHGRPIDAPGFVRTIVGEDGVDLWHNAKAYPRGFVVYRAEVAPDEKQEAAALASPKFRPGRWAIVDRPLPNIPAPKDGEDPPLPTEISALFREGAFDLAIEAQAAAPGVLVLSEPWYPGWHVTVDGAPATLLRVDLALRGVALTAGKHDVVMRYEDAPLARGAMITLSTLTLVVALLGLARRRQRRDERRATMARSDGGPSA